MGAASVIGYGLIGIAPHLVLFFAMFVRKHFMLLVMITSGFAWLVSLLFISLIVRGFVPLEHSVGSYAGVLVFAVTVQECVRMGCWWGYNRLLREVGAALRTGAAVPRAPASGGDAARRPRRRITVDDKFHLALSMGYGHGLCHSFFFFVSNLPVARRGGTYYNEQCPSMNYFLASALMTLGMTLIHTYSMPLAICAWEEDQYQSRMIFAVLLHYAAALATLANFRQNGCLGTAPALIFTGLVVMVWALLDQWARRADEEEDERSKEAAAALAAAQSPLTARSPPPAQPTANATTTVAATTALLSPSFKEHRNSPQPGGLAGPMVGGGGGGGSHGAARERSPLLQGASSGTDREPARKPPMTAFASSEMGGPGPGQGGGQGAYGAPPAGRPPSAKRPAGYEPF